MHVLKFTIKATITRFDTHQEWYYYSCPKCYIQVKESGLGWWCENHNHLDTLQCRGTLQCHGTKYTFLILINIDLI